MMERVERTRRPLDTKLSAFFFRCAERGDKKTHSTEPTMAKVMVCDDTAGFSHRCGLCLHSSGSSSRAASRTAIVRDHNAAAGGASPRSVSNGEAMVSGGGQLGFGGSSMQRVSIDGEVREKPRSWALGDAWEGD